MKIEIIRHNTRFLDIKKCWENLFDLGGYSVFQSFAFNYHSWDVDLSKDIRNQLAIVLVTKDERVVALFPFYVDAKQQLRFINDIHADFCDCISIETIDVSQLFFHIKMKIDFKGIRLINLKEDSRVKTYLQNIQLPNSLHLPFERYALTELEEGNFPDNYSEFKSKQVSEFRRIEKKNNDKTHVVLSVENQEFPERTILNLKEKMINIKMKLSMV